MMETSIAELRNAIAELVATNPATSGTEVPLAASSSLGKRSFPSTTGGESSETALSSEISHNRFCARFFYVSRPTSVPSLQVIIRTQALRGFAI